MRRSTLVLAILLSVSPGLAAANVQTFNVKTGYWRFTLVNDLNPASQLSPSALAHADHITLTNEGDVWTCTKNMLVAVNANTVKFKGGCHSKKDGTRLKGSGKFQVLDPKDTKAMGKIKLYMPGEPDPVVNNATLTGKWIEAACPAAH